MAKSSFSRYCEYKGNKAKYDLLTSISAILLTFAFVGRIIKWIFIILACYASAVLLYSFIKGCIHRKKLSKK